MKLSHLYFYNFKHIYIAGCPCENFDCDLLNELADSCRDLSSNENFQFCYQDLKRSLVECQDQCEVYDCMLECYEKYDSELEKCPCGPKCTSKVFSILMLSLI